MRRQRDLKRPEAADAAGEPLVALAAAKLGATRLIDNRNWPTGCSRRGGRGPPLSELPAYTANAAADCGYSQECQPSLPMQLRSDLDSLLASLTPREREIVLYVATGRANKVIAIDLGISLRTAEAHRAHIFEKLGVRNAMQLACRLCEHWRAGASPLLRHPDAAAVCAGASGSSASAAASDSSGSCSRPVRPAAPRGLARVARSGNAQARQKAGLSSAGQPG